MSYSACTCIQVLNFLTDEQIEREFSHLGLELEEDVNMIIDVDLKKELIKARLQSMMDSRCLDLMSEDAPPLEAGSPDYSTLSARSPHCSCRSMGDALDEIVRKLEVLGQEHALCQSVQEKVILLNETFLNMEYTNQTHFVTDTPSYTSSYNSQILEDGSDSTGSRSRSFRNDKSSLCQSSSWSIPFSSPSTSGRTTADSMSSELTNTPNFSLSHISSITGLDRDYETLGVCGDNGNHHYEPLRNWEPHRRSELDTPQYEVPRHFSRQRSQDQSVEDVYSVEYEYWSYINPDHQAIPRIKSMPNLYNYCLNPTVVVDDIQSGSHVTRICTQRQHNTEHMGTRSSSVLSAVSKSSSGGSSERKDAVQDLSTIDVAELRRRFAQKRLSSIFERGLMEMELKKKKSYWFRVRLRKLKRVSC
ncbi:hypothetical protein ACHWQZ_G001618 [Mnemiopsis leidyi]